MQTRTRPIKPSWLTPEGEEIWDFIEPLLVEAEMVTALDSFTLATYCAMEGQISSLEKQINGSGKSLLAHRKELALIGAIRKQLLALSDRLGLNPLARQCPESVLAIHYWEGQEG